MVPPLCGLPDAGPGSVKAEGEEHCCSLGSGEMGAPGHEDNTYVGGTIRTR